MALKHKPVVHKVDAFDRLIHSVGAGKAGEDCSDAACSPKGGGLIDNKEMIHKVARMAQTGEGKSREKAISFVKGLQRQIDEDYKNVMGFGKQTVKTAEHVFNGGPKVKVLPWPSIPSPSRACPLPTPLFPLFL